MSVAVVVQCCLPVALHHPEHHCHLSVLEFQAIHHPDPLVQCHINAPAAVHLPGVHRVMAVDKGVVHVDPAIGWWLL